MPRKLGSPGFVAFHEILRETSAGVSFPQTPTVAEGVTPPLLTEEGVPTLGPVPRTIARGGPKALIRPGSRPGFSQPFMAADPGSTCILKGRLASPM